MTNLTAAMIKELRERTGVGMAKCKEALVETDGNVEEAIAYLRKKGMASAVKKEGRETKEGSIYCAEAEQSFALLEVGAETDFVVKNSKFQTFVQDLAEQAVKTKSQDIETFLQETYLKDPSLTVEEYKNTIIQSLGENIKIQKLEIVEKKENASYGVYSHMNGQILALVEIEGSSNLSNLAKDIAMHIAAEDPEYLSVDDVPDTIKKKEEEIAYSQAKGKPQNMVEKIVQGKVKAQCEQICLLCQKFIKDPSKSIEKVVEDKAKETGKSLKISCFWRWAVA